MIILRLLLKGILYRIMFMLLCLSAFERVGGFVLIALDKEFETSVVIEKYWEGDTWRGVYKLSIKQIL